MTQTRRQRSPRGSGEQLREALLAKAAELLDTSYDVDSLSIRTLTSATGVSPTALYLHFADLNELIRAVKQRCFTELGDRLRAAIAAHPDDPRQRLRAACHAYLAYARRHPGHYAMMFHTTAPVGRTVSAPPDEVRTAGIDTFRLLVHAIAEALGCSEHDAFEAAAALWTSLHGRAHLTATLPWFGLPDEDRYVTLLVDQLVALHEERDQTSRTSPRK
ncbi:WHG domain-containing protein [Nocardia sp. CA-135953]|uniref:TetR-like C-terminal domain-containing protein n=1 Tax=Nocardia sp. CA-135953 TaxID=3239978 RepID=UPI003D99BC26